MKNSKIPTRPPLPPVPYKPNFYYREPEKMIRAADTKIHVTSNSEFSIVE